MSFPLNQPHAEVISADASAAAHEDTLRHLADDAEQWLREVAFPLWWSVGGDRAAGGFHEKISQTGAATGGPRRTRVVGRQIFSYATAASLNCYAEADAAVVHGVDFLLRRSAASEDLFHSSVLTDGTPKCRDFDLYDHAFALFGMAAAARVGHESEALAQRSLGVLRAIRKTYSHPGGGYFERWRQVNPLLANPHMHMLEACLEWIGFFDGRAPNDPRRDEWLTAAEDIVHLALTHFIQPAQGQLFEFFAWDWSPLGAEAGQIVEPGHQFEWAWLLLRWSAIARDAASREAALRMIGLSERFGLACDGVLVVNALKPDLGEADPAYRLWPNTERLKAHILVLSDALDPDVRKAHIRASINALRGLSIFLNTPVAGLWIDRYDATLAPMMDDAPASSLYHIVCGLRELINWNRATV